MRFLLLLTLAGCGGGATGNDDLAATGDMPAGGDMPSTMHDLAGATGDLAMSMMGDLSTPNDLAGAGQACKTACDCPAGFACPNGKCGMGQIPVYCCGSNTCPGSAVCQKQDTTFSCCGGSCPDMSAPGDMSGIQPGDGGVVCANIQCNGNAACLMIGCTQCVAGPKGKMVCN